MQCPPPPREPSSRQARKHTDLRSSSQAPIDERPLGIATPTDTRISRISQAPAMESLQLAQMLADLSSLNATVRTGGRRHGKTRSSRGHVATNSPTRSTADGASGPLHKADSRTTGIAGGERARRREQGAAPEARAAQRPPRAPPRAPSASGPGFQADGLVIVADGLARCQAGQIRAADSAQPADVADQFGSGLGSGHAAAGVGREWRLVATTIP